MTLLSFVIFTICLAMQCATMETDIDTKTIQHGGMHTLRSLLSVLLYQTSWSRFFVRVSIKRLVLYIFFQILEAWDDQVLQ